MLSALQAKADAKGEVDWGLHFVDATVIRAHQHAAGARHAGAIGGEQDATEGEALGRSQGEFSTKVHLRAEGNGKPITVVLTSGERHEQVALELLLDQGAIRRPGRGRPRLRPRAVAGDKSLPADLIRGVTAAQRHVGACADAASVR